MKKYEPSSANLLFWLVAAVGLLILILLSIPLFNWLFPTPIFG